MASLVSSNGSAIDGAGLAVVAGQIGCVLKARTAPATGLIVARTRAICSAATLRFYGCDLRSRHPPDGPLGFHQLPESEHLRKP